VPELVDINRAQVGNGVLRHVAFPTMKAVSTGPMCLAWNAAWTGTECLRQQRLGEARNFCNAFGGPLMVMVDSESALM
jgi:hypothetical protein